MIKIGINGFDRIAKMVFYSAIKKKKFNIVSINNIDINDLIYILKYDSAHKLPKLNIIKDKNNLIINNKHIIKITNDKNINWKDVEAKYIVDTTGNFLDKKSLYTHIKAGAKKVIITYPPKDDIPMFVLGVNHKLINKNDDIIYNSSCTTYCLAPILKILHREFKIIECFITIINSVNDKLNIVDGKNYRLGRSALCNIIPYKNKIYKEICKVIPEINGKINDITFIVPNINVSVVDLTIKIKKSTNYDNIKKIIKFYSKNELSGILGYIDNDKVTTDTKTEILDDTRTSIFDAKAGIMLNPNFFKIICWYYNEIGYSSKILDLIEYIETNF